MTREFCIEYIKDDCDDCPERNENGECLTGSHCFEVKRKIIEDLRKLDRIENLIEEYNNELMMISAIDYMEYIEGVLNEN